MNLRVALLPVMASAAILSLSAVGSGAEQARQNPADGSGGKPQAIQYNAKPFFPIGVWFEGDPNWAGSPSDPAGARAYYDRSFADIAAHGFNTVVVPNCPEELWETLLQSAKDNGIKVVLEIVPIRELIMNTASTDAQFSAEAKRVYQKIGKYSSLLRYQTRDEPWTELVPNWVKAQRALHAVDPTRPAFSCFCNPGPLESLLQITTLGEAVFDIYPLGPNAPSQTLGNFVATLDSYTQVASGVTRWPVLQSFYKAGSWRYPTPEELRAMTYLSLASGAKGMFYFIYQSLPQHPENLGGLVDANGDPLPLYATATALAKELKSVSGLMLSLKPATCTPKVTGDAKVSAFTGKSDRQVLIVASTRPDAAMTAVLGLDCDGDWTDAISGETFTTIGKSLTIPLAPGAGRVLVSE